MISCKICTECGVEKPMDNFYANASLRDGREKACIKCRKERFRLLHTGDSYDAVKRRMKARERSRIWEQSHPGRRAEIARNHSALLDDFHVRRLNSKRNRRNRTPDQIRNSVIKYRMNRMAKMTKFAVELCPTK